FAMGDNTLLVTYHPVTLEHQSAEQQMKALLKALDDFGDCQFLFTLPNADAGGRVIIECIREFVRAHPGRAYAFPSLGQLRYLSALQFVKAVIGNSSSGIIEVPYFGKPTVNIGDRQKGRIRPGSVIDVKPSAPAITAGIRKALSPAFEKKCRTVHSPYGKGEAAKKILEIIRKAGKLHSVKKHFFDLI
ncbi:MAG: UDP-N-acetylglucosamine 2-epimerase, partial [Bacteroidota bacterium]|nr:UDP-N-acetylglucosamine 2-epimerase [Bacteroidota bacterium]